MTFRNQQFDNAIPNATSASIVRWVNQESTNAYLPGEIQIFSVKSNPQVFDHPLSVSPVEVNRPSRRELMAEIMQEFTDNNDDLLLQLAR